jgi:hypothetical protein
LVGGMEKTVGFNVGRVKLAVLSGHLFRVRRLPAGGQSNLVP